MELAGAVREEDQTTYSRWAFSELDKHGKLFVAAESGEANAGCAGVEHCVNIDDTRSVPGPLDRGSMREQCGHEFLRRGKLNRDLAVTDLQCAAPIRATTVDGADSVQSLSGGGDFNVAITCLPRVAVHDDVDSIVRRSLRHADRARAATESGNEFTPERGVRDVGELHHARPADRNILVRVGEWE